MAFFCRHILWVYLMAMVGALCLIAGPFFGSYRKASWSLKSLLWSGGFLTFVTGALAQTLGYNLYHPFLSRGMLRIIVPTLHDLKFVSLGLILLLLCWPELWRIEMARRVRRSSASSTTTPDPVVT